jgi:hypothetical protein
LAGPKLPDDEREILVEYIKFLMCNGREIKKSKPAERQKGEQMENVLQIIIPFNGAATNLDMAAELRRRAGLLEGMSPKDASSRANTDSAPSAKSRKAPAQVEETEEVESDDEDFAPKKSTAKKAAASFDDDEENDEEEAPPKKKKAPKISLDDVNDACKARAVEEGGGKTGRGIVVAILKKKFKTESVGELKPEQYAAVIEAMTGE